MRKLEVVVVFVTLVIFFLGARHQVNHSVRVKAKTTDSPRQTEGDVLKRLAVFSKSEGSRIATLIYELKLVETSLEKKIIELQKTLEAFGRHPASDTEFISWNRQLAALKTDQVHLSGKLEEAFIWSEKFRLAPSAEHKAEYTARIIECNTLATELAGRYQGLLELKSTG